MRADLLAGLLAGLAVALPIGAIGSYLVGLAARERIGVAVAAALGVATTDGVYALAAGIGFAGVDELLGAIDRPLRVLAAVLLICLAVRNVGLAMRSMRPDPAGPATGSGRPVRAAPLQAATGSGRTPRRGSGRTRAGSGLRTYGVLVGLTAVNPATIATFGAVVVGHRLAGSPVALAAVVFASGAFAASAAWQLVLVGAGSILGRGLRGPRGQLVVACASGAAMVVLAALTVLG